MKRRVCVLLILAVLLSGCAAAGTGAMSSPAVTVSAPVAVAPTTVTAPSPATSTAPATTAIRNPVLDRDFPDPDVLDAGDLYYAYATNSGGMNILAASSPDLVNWRFIGNVLPRTPRWASKAFGYNWAPEVSRFGETYVMYFTTRFTIGSGGVQCIGVVTAGQPEGPFLPTETSNLEPLVCQQGEGGSIDPSVFVDDDGREYLLWKSDANSRGGKTWLYIQQLSADGLSLEGEPVRLITVTERWEGLLVEAPALWKHESKYYLFYSANDYRSRDYAVGYAVADAPAGPYTKGETNPILKTNLGSGVVGPGGQDVVTGPDGRPYMLFHAWTAGGYRALALAPLEWQAGVPVVTLPPRARSN